MALEDVEEFVEIVGTESKEPEPVFVLYRTSETMYILNKKDLPNEAIFIGIRTAKPHLEEWWSPEYDMKYSKYLAITNFRRDMGLRPL